MAFLSETLKKNDIVNKFSVPKEWVDEYWPNIGNNYRAIIKVWHQASMYAGAYYDFELSTRSCGYLKPEFMYKGWQEFVKSNNLKTGDVVHFGKRADEPNYTIIIEHAWELAL